ncbi:MAG: zinc-ribbon domain-containing protein [Thermoplasmata archaeon]
MGEQSPILIIPAIFGIIGAIMLLVGDFGGWYNYNYYAGYEEWIYVNVFGYAAVLILPMALLLFFSAAVSLKAFRSPPPVARKLVQRGLIAALVVLIITVIGAVALLAATMDASDNWLGVGFYGAFFGSLLASILLGYEYKRMGRAMPRPYPAPYQAPPPAYGPYAQPPPPQPAPQAPQPPPQPRCTNCGTPLQPGVKFCPTCGAAQA